LLIYKESGFRTKTHFGPGSQITKQFVILNVMVYLVVIIYLAVTILLTLIGIGRQNEGLKIFLISLLLTPIAAGGYMLFRKKKYKRIQFYRCPECKYIFPTKIKHCPICEEKGSRVKLERYHTPYKVAGEIQKSHFA
jgi:hypothetical protein